ncbi:MAG: pyruvate kinase [Kofleriaceae bacterium]|jgi:pyruvate kinase|nr:pyruvate kinase [Kofleriaceae bacterium]MBP6838000.1 pyruvate kinase [Kofleriaceae bacterium]MBP9205416.1 pyruvate kinase [Kofleriaceae bacterium]
MPRAKIVCTLGPASSSPERIGELIEAGMDVVRLNFSHGSHEDHARMLATVRSEAQKRGRAIAVLLDLQGPKIRVGRFATGQAELKPGAEFTISTDPNLVGDDRRVSTTYAGIIADVRPGDHLLLDDGYLSLVVTSVANHEVHTLVVTGGILKNNKGINLPGVEVSAPALSDKDREDIKFGLRHGVDYVALSFVRRAEDVREAKRLLTDDGIAIPVIAKIEKPQAIDRLAEIIDAADGIMVARGDLGVEMGPEKVPLIQKRIIEETNRRGKIVITATQMLESMIQQPRPTRAEASDVANAILDGTDAVMLSGETASGAHPVEAVRTMVRIVREVEGSAYYRQNIEPPVVELAVSANAIAHAAVIAARKMKVRTIAVVTGSGGAARLMSEYRPEAEIVALTTDEVQFRRLALVWGVTPVHIPHSATTDEVIDQVEATLLSRHLAVAGEHVIITMGVPVGAGVQTNLLKIHQMS